MAIRVDDLAAFFAWADDQAGRYAVLRSETRNGQTTELDLLMDDTLAATTWTRFPDKRRGVKLDIYDVGGHGRSAYHGFSHLPAALSNSILRGRRKEDGMFRASPADELNALMYHAAYHKPVQSGFDLIAGAHPSTNRPYSKAIAQAAATAGVSPPHSLEEMHQRLSASGFGVDRERLVAYVQQDFRKLRKSFFHAWLMNQATGELNLFVIRGIAVKHGLVDALLEKLADAYELWQVKPVSFRDRLTKMKHMRGGKWKRGGKPHVAVVVFDPDPIESTEQERAIHPYVFNARQFVKQGWRSWFTETSGARSKDNPIHSTDNEAEAIGHLPLFFDSLEQAEILERLAARRSTQGPTNVS